MSCLMLQELTEAQRRELVHDTPASMEGEFPEFLRRDPLLSEVMARQAREESRIPHVTEVRQ